MPVTTFTLLAEETSSDCNYIVTIDETDNDRVRLNIEAISESPSGFNNSQGIDISAAECEAIGKHLLALAARLNSRSKDSL